MASSIEMAVADDLNLVGINEERFDMAMKGDPVIYYRMNDPSYRK